MSRVLLKNLFIFLIFSSLFLSPSAVSANHMSGHGSQDTYRNGWYTNMCGSGTDADGSNRSGCSRDCDPRNGKCTTPSLVLFPNPKVVKFVCPNSGGPKEKCENSGNKSEATGWDKTKAFDDNQPDTTYQIDIFYGPCPPTIVPDGSINIVCNDGQGLKDYLVWYNPPVFDYNISANNATVTQGESKSVDITATKTSGNSQQVTFTFSNLPSNVSASTASCNPTCTTNTLIRTSLNTQPENYTITVRGSPLNKSDTFTLTVLPAAPSNVTLSPISDGNNRCSNGYGEVTLEWSSNGTNTSKFQILDANDRVLKDDISSNARSTTISELYNNQNYTFKIRAVGPTGLTATSNQVSALTRLCAAPSQPSIDSADSGRGLGCDGIYPYLTVRWGTPANTSASGLSYNIFRGDSRSDGTYVGTVTGNSFTDSRIINNEYYNYYVEAVITGSTQRSEKSSTVVSGNCSPPRMNFIDTDCSDGTRGGFPITKTSWDMPFAPTGSNFEYVLGRRYNDESGNIAYAYIGQGTSWNDRTELDNAPYYYQIGIWSPVYRNIVWSGEKFGRYSENCSFPSGVTVVPACQAANPSMAISWDRTNTGSYFEMFVERTSAAPGNNPIYLYANQATSYTDFPALNNEAYYYRVTIHGTRSNKYPYRYSDTYVGKYSNNCAPPAMVSVEPVCPSGKPGFNVKWASPPTGPYYDYFLERTDVRAGNRISYVYVNQANEYQDIVELNNSTYRYRVIIYGSKTNTYVPSYNQLSDVSNYCTAPPPPADVQAVINSCIASGPIVEISWTELSGLPSGAVVDYHIYRNDNGNNYDYLQTVQNINHFDDSVQSRRSLLNSSLYRYYVVSEYKGQRSQRSNVTSEVITRNCNAPNQPTLSTDCSGGNPFNTINWTLNNFTPPSKIANYSLLRNDGYTTSSGNPPVNDAAVLENNSYNYQVRSTDIYGSISPYSARSNTETTKICAPPTVTLNANPSTVQQGDKSNLNWSTSNADTCVASNNAGDSNWTNSVGVGSLNTRQTSAFNTVGTYTYSISCNKTGNPTPATATTTITVTPKGKPFIQTTGGDVHSNKNIETQSAPSPSP